VKVLNIHSREINQPKRKVLELFSTLATEDDKVWPVEKWPPMRFKNGLKEGSEGGHGSIKYKVVKYDPTELVEFKFQSPKGFNGTHKFEVIEQNDNKTEFKHTIEMKTHGIGTLSWVLVIRWLHDALLEDALDKVENQFTDVTKRTEWNSWVNILRKIMKPKKKAHNTV